MHDDGVVSTSGLSQQNALKLVVSQEDSQILRFTRRAVDNADGRSSKAVDEDDWGPKASLRDKHACM